VNTSCSTRASVGKTLHQNLDLSANLDHIADLVHRCGASIERPDVDGMKTGQDL
jgi:hypothetical protein